MKTYSLHPESIRNLFNNLAPTYDLLNHLLSLRRDFYWRKMAVREFKGYNGWMLDVATGTGDVVIEMIRQEDHERKVFGIDFSGPMIRKAREKLSKKGLIRKVGLGLGDALSLPFRENTFSGSLIAFGI
ncbi:MAG: class I SAM-dependent methyltransferase [Deltaproteobacteria bacterium]|nr:class I SAM-dependent methyltransferase [Deltaproteobacteria bacterium]